MVVLNITLLTCLAKKISYFDSLPLILLFSPGQDKDNAMATRLQEIYKELMAIESDKAPAKAAMILNGLGFSSSDQQRQTR